MIVNCTLFLIFPNRFNFPSPTIFNAIVASVALSRNRFYVIKELCLSSFNTSGDL
ncbi:hypothetical protein HanRHA438_Chr08g0336751 [Helianthus annuus]|uniref:Uncharacterized protein n=1 Tax=Helianthus annuus TaxID=4232 RepID=A0A251U3U8_HELAN|nr:hypothetical protein HanXRQr2_Chr08g0325561 [Helianthus annuus]KAJ0552502.1 hypothetical protein HanHA89_Chr08g0285971 [Helianthus annuus]KAJ0896628.1 hypothetical protein HanRHA438_Chr08g0336751 [Helianthus annuus]